MGYFFSFPLIYTNVATITMISQPHFHKCFLHDASCRANKVQCCTKAVVERGGSCPDLCGFPLKAKMTTQNSEGSQDKNRLSAKPK